MSDTTSNETEATLEEWAEEAQAAARNKKVLAKLVTRLADPTRTERATAAHLVHEVACLDAARLAPHVDQLVDALGMPEPQTRWEVLGARGDCRHVCEAPGQGSRTRDPLAAR